MQGLERDRFAILTKTHHAMVDGISGVDIGTVLFDLEPVPEPAAGRGRLGAAADAEHGRAGRPRRRRRRRRRRCELAERAVERGAPPGDRRRARSAEALEGVGEVVGAFADPAPDVPLNQPIGPHRRFVWARSELATFKRIKDALGGTVNDVVLAVVTGALRDWLHGRGIRTEGLELRALVPVSIRTEDERGDLGNRIAVMRGPLPVYVEDPVRRLRVVSEQMEGLKRSKQALGAEVISRFNDFAPPTLLAQASRINFSTRLFNLIVTNVPGPQIPLYVLGRELEEVFPVAFLPQNHALAVAIMSYNGQRRLRPARRLRLDGGRRSDRRRDRRFAGRARAGGQQPSSPDGRGRVSRLKLMVFLVVLFIVVPIVELYVIIQVGRSDRGLADPGAAARRRPARLAAAAPPGPRRLAALQRGAGPAPLPRHARSPTA